MKEQIDVAPSLTIETRMIRDQPDTLPLDQMQGIANQDLDAGRHRLRRRRRGRQRERRQRPEHVLEAHSD